MVVNLPKVIQLIFGRASNVTHVSMTLKPVYGPLHHTISWDVPQGTESSPIWCMLILWLPNTVGKENYFFDFNWMLHNIN